MLSGLNILHHVKVSSSYSLVRQFQLEKQNLYKVLGVASDASPAEIKEAYYKLSKQCHPDIATDSMSHTRFIQISAAYEVLGNTLSRRRYDKGVQQNFTIDQDDLDHLNSLRRYQQRNRFRYRSNVPPPTGRTKYYNYDEFYRMHYGDKNPNSDSNEYSDSEYYFDNPLGIYKKRHADLLTKFREDNMIDLRTKQKQQLSELNNNMNSPDSSKEWIEIRSCADKKDRNDVIINSMGVVSMCTFIAVYYVYFL